MADEAQKFAENALKINENCADAHFLLAALNEGKDNEAALLHAERAVAIEPTDPVHTFAAASIHFSLNNHATALRMFETAYNLSEKTNDVAFGNIVYLQQKTATWAPLQESENFEENRARWRDTMRFLEEKVLFQIQDLERREPPASELKSGMLVTHPHMSLTFPFSPKTKLKIAHWFWRIEKATVFSSSHVTSPFSHSPKNWEKEGKSRIRLAYISSDFRNKATAYLVLHMFEQHTNQFEIFLFATTGNSDLLTILSAGDWRKEIETKVEHFYDVSAKSPFEIAQFIREKKIQILIDMDGYANQGIRKNGVLSFRPAPIQCSWLAYISTSGNEEVDYIITDVEATPASSLQFYSEKPLYLEKSYFVNSFMWNPNVQHVSLKVLGPSKATKTLFIFRVSFKF
eukprot:TRINITY_DN7728_c0_g1_i1.p1 TRINITY_DN7728_c0_g1~~TRINITY_DN7728_c0_g1_i1.p1  ORF type:complete len:463 (+),score=114.10 TRINITY_DN7728_c0_g1_i1:184-1389(+)